MSTRSRSHPAPRRRGLAGRTSAGGELLVALDGSPASERSLMIAVDLARRLGAGLRLAQVIPTPNDMMTGWGHLLDDARPQPTACSLALRRLSAAARRLGDVTGLQVTATVEPADDVATRLVGLAVQHGARAIVLRSRPHGRIAQAVLGSVTTRVLQQSFLPVVVVPALLLHHDSIEELRAGEHARPTEGPRERASAHYTLLVALDVTEPDVAARVLRHLRVLTHTRHTSVVLVHVVADSETPAERNGAAARLAACEAQLRASGVATRSEVVAAAGAAAGVMAAGDRHAATLLVLASRRHSGLHRLACGSTIDTLARHASRPLWIIPHRLLSP